MLLCCCNIYNNLTCKGINTASVYIVILYAGGESDTAMISPFSEGAGQARLV